MSLDRLREIADGASPGEWQIVGYYVCFRGSDGEAHPIARTPRDAQGAERDAPFIATFDPPTVKALLDVAECARRAADEPWDGGIDAQPASSLTVTEMELRDALARLREVSS